MTRYLLACALAFATCASASERWPLEYQGQSTNAFIWDKRAETLIRSTVPRARADDLLDGMGGPPDPVMIRDARYFSASACVLHACPTKSFFWYDTRTGDALGAILEDWGDAKLTLMSRGIQREHIPAPAMSALKAWMVENDFSPRSVVFVDARGRSNSLDVSMFQDPTRFEPSASGPSFDCTLAGTKVEKSDLFERGALQPGPGALRALR
ncbi:hypothetical protein LVB87_00720 [Lysobacter sp. KIS68-7]|uniref:hypothetical protein n=1 Tax=Lysobacter sp. KIS68-7 TaxID=2904252 RepID=UPI001E4B96AE|nr:hypothetical protein [Lysobacter sp. KIS68-7]UHQ19726.1 hypothetical protein LVB87_00720 [Lysobacter sp. KIS68-7]